MEMPKSLSIDERIQCALDDAINTHRKIPTDAQGAAYIRSVVDNAIDDYWRETGGPATAHFTGTHCDSVTASKKMMLVRVFWYSPLYTHDCDMCVYLGTTDSYDVHVHFGSFGTSIVLRHGNSGPDFVAVPEIVAKSLDPDSIIYKIVLCALSLIY